MQKLRMFFIGGGGLVVGGRLERRGGGWGVYVRGFKFYGMRSRADRDLYSGAGNASVPAKVRLAKADSVTWNCLESLLEGREISRTSGRPHHFEACPGKKPDFFFADSGQLCMHL